jgi:hypothetical protein
MENILRKATCFLTQPVAFFISNKIRIVAELQVGEKNFSQNNQ